MLGTSARGRTEGSLKSFGKDVHPVVEPGKKQKNVRREPTPTDGRQENASVSFERLKNAGTVTKRRSVPFGVLRGFSTRQSARADGGGVVSAEPRIRDGVADRTACAEESFDAAGVRTFRAHQDREVVRHVNVTPARSDLKPGGRGSGARQSTARTGNIRRPQTFVELREFLKAEKRRSPPVFFPTGFICGGEEEDRTPDLCIANAALSQLSYPPTES